MPWSYLYPVIACFPFGYLIIKPYLWQFFASQIPSLVFAKLSSTEFISKASPVWCSDVPGLAENVSASA